MDPLIEVVDFHKAYRATVAVEALSFALMPGQVLGLVGPNGAGKTSTLRCLAGIIPPTRGSLRVAGHDIEHDAIAAKQMLAYVPDDPRLFDALTVWEHIEFVAAAYRVADWEAKGAGLIERFELQEKRDTMAQELSRGMRQKTAICCAYLHDPRVLCFDEPHTGLDPRGIRTMKDSIVERAGAGAAIIVSSHMLELVEDLCSHLLILHRGRQVFLGSMEEARTTFADSTGAASLEEAFFRATEGVTDDGAAASGAPPSDAAAS